MRLREAILCRLSVAVALGCVALACAVTRADEGSSNAAERYREAWASMRPAFDEFSRLRLYQDRSALEMPEWELSDQFSEGHRRFVANVDDWPAHVRWLVDATTPRRCDFELSYELGPSLGLPHVSEMRATGLLLLLEAREHLAAGDVSAAAELIAAAFRVSGHLS